MSLAGHLVARIIGVRTARFLIGLESFFPQFNCLPEFYAEQERAALEPVYTRHGVDFDGLVGGITLDPCPGGEARLAVQYVCYNGASASPQWLLRKPTGTRRTCVTRAERRSRPSPATSTH